MASPILTFSHESSNVETFLELALVGTPDQATQLAEARKGTGPMSNPKLDNSGKSREGQLFGIDSHVLNRDSRFHLLSSYHNRGLKLIPLRPRSKIPLVKWKDYRLTDEDLLRFLGQGTN